MTWFNEALATKVRVTQYVEITVPRLNAHNISIKIFLRSNTVQLTNG